MNEARLVLTPHANVYGEIFITKPSTLLPLPQLPLQAPGMDWGTRGKSVEEVQPDKYALSELSTAMLELQTNEPPLSSPLPPRLLE